MRHQLVYDLPTRLFHWLFAGLFIFAFLTTKVVDDESPLFSYHMLAGLLLAFVVLLRIIWGLLGSRNARFSALALSPAELVGYFKGILSGDKRKWSGHNPASSWATLMMLSLALGLAVSGVLMGNGYKESLEDVHELMANGFLVVVLLHVAGVVMHALRHQDGIALSMVDGRKDGISTSDIIPSSYPVAGLLFVVLVGSFSLYLGRNFDSQAGTLQFFGSTLQMGESEGSEGQSGENEGAEGKDGDHDDD